MLQFSFLEERFSKDRTATFTSDESLMLVKECIGLGDKEVFKANQQDLVCLLGNTGSGKSTFANYYHGCQMELVDAESIGVMDSLFGEAPLELLDCFASPAKFTGSRRGRRMSEIPPVRSTFATQRNGARVPIATVEIKDLH